jgi:hypothetical protein
MARYRHNPIDWVHSEPTGPTGIFVTGLANPAPVADRTSINRSEAYLMLQGHSFDLTIPARLQEALRTGSPPKLGSSDPSLRVSPEVRFQFMTEADIDPRTGMPRVQRVRGRERVLYSRFSTFSLSSTSFFTETSKMSAASWSLPAGPPDATGGTCQASELFRKPDQYRKALQQTRTPARRMMPDVKNWICAYCYAGKSNYMHRTAQYSQTARWVWLREMLKHNPFDHVCEIMAEAVIAHLLNVNRRRKKGEDSRFFRIHDSGDFTLNPNTYLLWREIAMHPRLGHVSFWAPTRMWVFPKFVEMIRKNRPPKNLSVRPSALHFGDPAPKVPGLTAGTSAHGKDTPDPIGERTSKFSCPAYEYDGSCSGSKGPAGRKPCRACWSFKNLTVSYKAH